MGSPPSSGSRLWLGDRYLLCLPCHACGAYGSASIWGGHLVLATCEKAPGPPRAEMARPHHSGWRESAAAFLLGVWAAPLGRNPLPPFLVSLLPRPFQDLTS